jgi:hypothetical protein
MHWHATVLPSTMLHPISCAVCDNTSALVHVHSTSSTRVAYTTPPGVIVLSHRHRRHRDERARCKPEPERGGPGTDGRGEASGCPPPPVYCLKRQGSCEASGRACARRDCPPSPSAAVAPHAAASSVGPHSASASSSRVAACASPLPLRPCSCPEPGRRPPLLENSSGSANWQ